MSDASEQPQELAKQQSIIDVLVRETHMPPDVVKNVYVIEHAKLERVARIKTYVPVLASRQVKLVLSTTYNTNDSAATH